MSQPNEDLVREAYAAYGRGVLLPGVVRPGAGGRAECVMVCGRHRRSNTH